MIAPKTYFPAGPRTSFSRREEQIVYAMMQAKAAKDIARELDLSVNTVKDYLKSIYRKAEVHSARELMRQYHASRGVPADAGLAEVLEQVQRLGEPGSPREALQQLQQAVCACTPARRVSFWRWVRSGPELLLVEEPAIAPAALLRVNGFGPHLRARGWARLEAHEMGGRDGRELSRQGIGGELIALACAPALRVQVMLASDPAGGRFGPLDTAIMRLLARLIHFRDCGAGQAALGVSA